MTSGERRAVCRAPQGAAAWIPRVGWTDDGIEIRQRQEAGEPVYVVAHGEVSGVADHLIAAVMRIDAQRQDLHERIAEVYEHGHGHLTEARR